MAPIRQTAPDPVKKLLQSRSVSPKKIFQEAYKDSSDPTVGYWAYDLWMRCGIVTACVRAYCEEKLQLPLETPDYPEAHTETFG